MKTNKEIKAELENMKKQPMFEINLLDYIPSITEDKYTYCYINYDEDTNMLQFGHCGNGGFIRNSEIEYDKDLSLNQNLEGLLEVFIEYSINKYYNNEL